MTRLSPPAQAVRCEGAAAAAPRRFRISSLALAVAAACGLWGTQADALTLGRLNVLSSLGEPLRAEVEVTEVTPAEAANLQVRLAPPQAFQRAGMGFSDALNGVRSTVQRRGNGYVVSLTGIRPMNDPFVDILLEANSPSGRLMRDYTALIDPPPVAPSASAPPGTAAGTTSERQVAPLPPQVSAPASAGNRRRPVPAEAPAAVAVPPAPAPAAAPPVSAPPVPAAGAVAVRRGDTAGGIAAASKPADVSLDQMLVAMLRANPSAFAGNNVNRLRAGAVLQMPSAEDARATPPEEARRTIVAQSRDFNSYRQRLAGNAPTMNVGGAGRQSSGGLQASVQDRAAAAASPDRLTISRGNAPGQPEERLARERQAQESNTRVAELSRNIEELNRLQGTTGSSSAAPVPAPASPANPAAAAPVPAGTASSAAPAPGAAGTATVPAPAGAAAPAPLAGASSPAGAGTATTPAAPASAAASGAAAPRPAPAPATPPAAAAAADDDGFLASLLAQPLLLGGGAVVLLLLLLALAAARRRRKKQNDAADSMFPESLQKEGYIGGSGGATVDTRDDHGGASSLHYSPSQLDAGDVDPVAEADVYLAYGRDLQAEEILKEALRAAPERTAVQVKLLEIYARRRDARAFELLALELRSLTDGKGADWSRAQELGRGLDPDNPLYDNGLSAGDAPLRPPAGSGAASAAAAGLAGGAALDAALATEESKSQGFLPSVAPLDFDLDLDLPTADAPTTQPPAPAPSPAAAPPGFNPLAAAHKDIGIEPSGFGAAATQPPAPSTLPPSLRSASDEPTIPAPLRHEPMRDLSNDFDTAPAELEPRGGPHLPTDDLRTEPATLRAPLSMGGADIFSRDFHASMTGPADTQPMDLQLNIPTGIDAGPGESADSVKLSLARELHALGDPDGARTLLEEIVADSSGAVQEEARRLLDELR